MSESYFKPSTVWIYPDSFRSFLNDSRHKHTELLSLMLRKYDGIYFDFTRIREKDLATTLGISVAEVKQGVMYLELNGILEYREENSNAFLTFVYKRPAHDSIIIPKAIFEDRKQIMYDQLMGVINYGATKACRQLYIDRHFGFENNTRCGICDNCTNAYDVDKVMLKEAIMASIRESSSRVIDLLKDMSIDEQEYIKKLLKLWESEKIISIKQGRVSLL